MFICSVYNICGINKCLCLPKYNVLLLCTGSQTKKYVVSDLMIIDMVCICTIYGSQDVRHACLN